MAAAACAYAAGAELAQIQAGLNGFSAVAGRMKLQRAVSGARVIDDSYNANPGSVCAAMDSLVAMASASPVPMQTIFVLGDMGELGSRSDAIHAEMGAYARDQGIDCFLSVGCASALASREFGPGAYACDSHEQAIEQLEKIMAPSSTVLIKGSRSARMEVIVQAIMVSGDE